MDQAPLRVVLMRRIIIGRVQLIELIFENAILSINCSRNGIFVILKWIDGKLTTERTVSKW